MQYRSVTVLAPAKLNLSLDVVGTLPHASDADIDEALAGARQAFAAWKRTSVMERS